jgi:hypothetical protein
MAKHFMHSVRAGKGMIASPMWRRLIYRFLLALSILMLIVTVADWIHSLTYSETLIVVRGPVAFAIDNCGGEVAFFRGEFKPGQSFPDGSYHEHWKKPNAFSTLQASIDYPMGGEAAFAGFVLTEQRHFPSTSMQTFSPTSIGRHLAVVVPSWFLTVLFGAMPAITLYRFVRGRRRRDEGLCRVCGYDLRATSDRCPECGTPLTTQTATNPSLAPAAARGRQTPS